MRFRAKTMNANLVIERKRAGADESRELSGGSPPREIHLKEAVLGVKKAKRARDIFTRCAADRRDAEAITRHLDRRREARKLPTAVKLRQARAQLAARPQGTRDSRGKDDGEHDQERFEEATHFAGML
jgi:hypothetical protein